MLKFGNWNLYFYLFIYLFFAGIIMTTSDMIHLWSMPSLGMKMDGTPERLNQSSLFPNQPCLSFGQCSEICGINHSFMPIYMETSLPLNFMKWLSMMINNLTPNQE